MVRNVVDRSKGVDVISRKMFTEKIARLTSEFTSRILDALRAASLTELAAHTKPAAPRAPKPSAPRKVATKRAAPKKVAPEEAAVKRTPKKVVATTVQPGQDVTAAALSFFAERGRKGATVDQLRAHLAELGLASNTDVFAVLAEQGAIRDAGFRRSTGTGNKTSSVFVSAAT
jgi:hypothetical protein